MLKHCLSASIFKVLVAFAQITGGVLPDAQQSSTVFEESRDIIVRHVQRYLVDAVRQSPYYAISVDEKDAMIIIVITFLDKSRQKAWAPLQAFSRPGGSRSVSGHHGFTRRAWLGSQKLDCLLRRRCFCHGHAQGTLGPTGRKQCSSPSASTCWTSTSCPALQSPSPPASHRDGFPFRGVSAGNGKTYPVPVQAPL